MGLDAVRSRVEDVEGWLTDPQVARLHRAAAETPSGGRIVEIGSFRGRSTIVLASSARRDVEIVAIDPHAGNDRGPQEISGYEDEATTDNEVFERNLTAAGVRQRVRHVREFSNRAQDQVDDPIDVLFIDGAHRYRPARDDIRDWGARVRLGGRMLVHDSFSSIGVTGAILSELVGSGHWRYDGRSRSLTEYTRTECSRRERVRGAVRQLAQLGWFARNVVIKTLVVAKLEGVARRLGHEQGTWPH